MRKKKTPKLPKLTFLIFAISEADRFQHCCDGHLRKPAPQQPKRFLQKQKTSQTKENHPKETCDHFERPKRNQNLFQQNLSVLSKHLTCSLLPKSDQNH